MAARIAATSSGRPRGLRLGLAAAHAVCVVSGACLRRNRRFVGSRAARSPFVSHLLFGVLGGAVMVAGILVIVFNAALARGMLPLMRRVPPWRRLIDNWQVYQPGTSGRVPMLTFIAVGWVLVGGVFVWVAVTNQPL